MNHFSDRDRFETGIISTLCQDTTFKPSNTNWLGNFVPNDGRTRVQKNRMWVSDKADLDPLTEAEFRTLERLIRKQT